MSLRSGPVERVLWIASEYPPFVYGGLGTHVFELTGALARRGVTVDLFVPDNGTYAEPPDGLTLHPVAISRPRSNLDLWLSFCAAVVERARAEPVAASVIHCHDWMTALAGGALAQLSDRPWLLAIHLPQVEPANVALEEIGLASADRVVVNSRAVGEEIVERGIAAAPPAVIPNGVDIERFTPMDPPSTDQRVLFVGRLVAQKGVDWLLKSFAVAAGRLPDMRLVIVGDGEQHLYLLRVARHLGISGRVTFAGWKTGDALVSEYRQASVVVVPSWYEPFGIVALEAMACGRPVICTRTGGLPELVVDGVNGFTVEAGDYLTWAARLVQVLANPSLARRLAAAGRETAMRYSWEAVAERTVALYEQVAAEGRTRSRAHLHEVLARVSPLLAASASERMADLLKVVAGDGGGSTRRGGSDR